MHPHLLVAQSIGIDIAHNPAKRENVALISMESKVNGMTDTLITATLHLTMLTDALAIAELFGRMSTTRAPQTLRFPAEKPTGI